MDDHEIEEIFAMIDKNKDGKLTKKELQAFFKKNECKYKSKEIQNFIKHADQDGDGKLSLSELKALLRRTS